MHNIESNYFLRSFELIKEGMRLSQLCLLRVFLVAFN